MVRTVGIAGALVRIGLAKLARDTKRLVWIGSRAVRASR